MRTYIAVVTLQSFVAFQQIQFSHFLHLEHLSCEIHTTTYNDDEHYNWNDFCYVCKDEVKSKC